MSEEEADAVEVQRLKAAVHYSVGVACEAASEETGSLFSRELVATVTEIAYRQCEILAADVEAFAKHAKRTTVSSEDVKLCCRRSSDLLSLLNRITDELKASKEAQHALT